MADDNSTNDLSSSEDENDSRPHLRPLIMDKSITSAFDKTPHKFVPEGIIEEITTEEMIKASLNVKGSSKEETEIIEFIKTRAKKTFAIVIWIKPDNIMSVMKSLKKKGIDDRELPIKDEKRLGLKRWASEFYDGQWRFLAPVFSTDDHNHDLDPSHILPFVSKQKHYGTGCFGVVSQYVVHRNHLIPTLSEDMSFAVKEIKDTEDAKDVEEHWGREVRALRTMNGLNQDHIVRFVTAFRRKSNFGNEHYLIFEWADGGNLCDLWRRMPSPVPTAQVIKDIVKQILGLAKALEAAHNLNETGASYRHGDIKPENILVFRGKTSVSSDEESIGTFKIADWGEAREHEQATEMRPNKTVAKYGTRRYEALEVETGVPSARLGTVKKRRSRLYDIWAMGCITLELIIWLLYGADGVKRFHKDLGNDSFYEIVENKGTKEAKANSRLNEETVTKEAMVHSIVKKWMDHMAAQPGCEVGTTAIGNLLEIVQTALLVVKLPQRLGTTISHQTERLRRDSATTSLGIGGGDVVSSESNFEEDAATYAEKPRSDIPSFRITPADPVPIEPSSGLEPELRGHYRCLATDFRRRLEVINGEDEDETYWGITGSQRPMPGSTSMSFPDSPLDHGTVTDGSGVCAGNSDPINQSLVVSEKKKVNYASPELDENDWKYQTDNTVAMSLLTSLATMNALRRFHRGTTSQLCANCIEFQDQVLSPGFSMIYDARIMKQNAMANICDLCTLLWNTVTRHGDTASPTVKFDRSGPFLRLMNNDFPVLSIVRDSAEKLPMSTDIQAGFVVLPEAGSIAHCEAFKHWLVYCDQKHKCAPSKHTDNRVKPRLPTRLLDLGVDGGSAIRLWATTAEDTGEWVALSHRWGWKHFSTTSENLQSHLSGIDMSSLPATFKDAVTVTRALGRRYLWIDSLCVIQGPDGDFLAEAKRMEEVYSGAYCVIAASCAVDHHSGFLRPRDHRDYVGLCRDGKDQQPFYVCQNIDNFKSHVLDGELHARGWVLQEHALARRTLFFTKHQTYFECGEGVRCETSTMLSNKLAAFLGDPEFPHILSNASQGERILRYQELYRKYSRLELSQQYDRPTAIEGLQQRLIRTMHVKGGFGVFDEGVTRGLLRRSLLWRRGIDTPSLTRIHFPNASALSAVPSWSWMAYIGGIDYLQPGFGNYEWEDLQSPWSKKTPHNISSTDFSIANTALIATAREYDLGAAVLNEGQLIFDTPNRSSMPRTLCVVLGKAKGSPLPETQRHYLLIITAARHEGHAAEPVYERVGAGYLPGKCISPNGFSVRIH